MVKKLQALKAKKGFTLVELIVVIAIIGVLAAILIPTLSGVIESSRKRSVESTCSDIHTLAVTFAAQVLAVTGNAVADSTTAYNVDLELEKSSSATTTFTQYVEDQIPETKDTSSHTWTATFDGGKVTKVTYKYGAYEAEWNSTDGQKSATKAGAAAPGGT